MANFGRIGDKIRRFFGSEPKPVRDDDEGCGEADGDENEIPCQTGIETIDNAQRALGLDTDSGRIRMLGNTVGWLPGGNAVQIFMDGAAGDKENEEIYAQFQKDPAVRKAWITMQARTGQHLPLTPENLNAFVCCNNPALHETLENGRNFADSAAVSTAAIVGGVAANAILPGSGLIVGGAKMIAGGYAASVGYNKLRGHDNGTNIPALALIALHYEENGGPQTPAFKNLVTALARLDDHDQKEIERSLGMTLEDALITYIRGEEAIANRAKPGKDYAKIESVMTSNGSQMIAGEPLDVDKMLRLATGEMAGRGKALPGDPENKYYTLGEAYANNHVSVAEIILGNPALALRENHTQRMAAGPAVYARHGQPLMEGAALRHAGVTMAHADGAALPLPYKACMPGGHAPAFSSC